MSKAGSTKPKGPAGFVPVAHLERKDGVMDDDTPSVPAVADRKKGGSRKYPRTGNQTGIKGVVAVALMREGQSITQAAVASGLCRETVSALRSRWGEGLQHIAQIRSVIQDLGILTAAELLFGISEADIARMSVEKRLEVAAKFIDRYAAPEQANTNPFLAIFNQYNLQPSHSASKLTRDIPALPQASDAPTAS